MKMYRTKIVEPRGILISILGRFCNGKDTYGLLLGEKNKIVATLRGIGVSVETIVNDKEQTLNKIKNTLGGNIDYSKIEKLLPQIAETASSYLCTKCQAVGYLR